MIELTLNDLLAKGGIDPTKTNVARHKAKERALRRALPWIAAEHPKAFAAFQSVQGTQKERMLASRRYLASFVALETEETVLAGIY